MLEIKEFWIRCKKEVEERGTMNGKQIINNVLSRLLNYAREQYLF